MFCQERRKNMRKAAHDSKHLTLDERKIIQTGIGNGSSKSDIARVLSKDPTTIAKEIRKNRVLKPRNTYGRHNICIFIKECGKRCVSRCPRYKEPSCRRRDISPGACNKCPDLPKCHLDKYFYKADAAHEAYRETLVESRIGINLTEEKRKEIGQTIAPLLKQGQSVYQILSAHGEIDKSIRAVYGYIESGVFKDFGVDNFSLKEQVSRKRFKRICKPRKKKPVYEGRLYKDLMDLLNEDADIRIAEMDTLMNSLQGPYIQTFIFTGTGFMIGYIHKQKTAASMASTFDTLESILGGRLFSLLLGIVLTDRGAEFETFDLFEKSPDGSTRCSLFYCDPMQSSQKPHVENNHNYVRDIIPNEYPLDGITQDDLNLAFSHINSVPRKSFGGKTPYEVFTFLYGEEAAGILNIECIARDDVTLKPSLLRHAFKRNKD